MAIEKIFAIHANAKTLKNEQAPKNMQCKNEVKGPFLKTNHHCHSLPHTTHFILAIIFFQKQSLQTNSGFVLVIPHKYSQQTQFHISCPVRGLSLKEHSLGKDLKSM